mmetsp:Transcript_4112/g.3984  ORF Transcript_4112/g.3984 Transcript_4112/m.3984 type:complete len:80 (+) Transcript_4112:502-741(+)
MQLFKLHSVVESFKSDPSKQRNLIEAFLKANLQIDSISDDIIYRMIELLSLNNDILARKYQKEKGFKENLLNLLDLDSN